jgi:hypothetical protein
MFLGAFAWALIVALTRTDSDLIAIGVGVLVGVCTLLARPARVSTAVVVAAFAIASCALGDLLAKIILYSHDTGVTLGRAGVTALRQLDVFYFQTLSAMSYLCWAAGGLAAFVIVYLRTRSRGRRVTESSRIHTS